jgi:mercuric ion transport protein
MRKYGLLAGSLVAAFGASLCCILPLLVAAIGTGSLAVAAKLELWRPYLLGVSLLLLSAGVILARRQTRVACTPGTDCSKTPRANRMLWPAVLVVVAVAAFPYYSSRVARAAPQNASQRAENARALATLHLKVTGMTCPACASGLASSFRNIVGVKTATVDFESGKATIVYESGVVSAKTLEKIVTDTGYRLLR